MSRLGFYSACLFMMIGFLIYGREPDYSRCDSIFEAINIETEKIEESVFYENNPLTDLSSFVVITSFPIGNQEAQKLTKDSLENVLSNIGEVIHLKENDMRGFGAGNILLIQIGDVISADAAMLEIVRYSLCIESPVVLEKSGIKSFPMIWGVNTFLKGKIGDEGLDSAKAVKQLAEQFIQSYQVANKDKRPIFYFYD